MSDNATGGGVQTVTVAQDETDLRLDRWFKRHFPALSHGRLEKLLRKGEIRVDGKRAKAGLRLAAGQLVRVPPMQTERSNQASRKRDAGAPVTEADAEALRRAVLYRDDMAIAIDKPPGLAVQGGTRTRRHLDGMLDALRYELSERPRLVHRLDRDTSGVLILGRSLLVVRVVAVPAGQIFAVKNGREALGRIGLKASSC